MTAVPRTDVEAAWVAYLRSHGVPARTQVPDEHVDGMVRVSRVSGQRQSPISEQTAMLVECWAASRLAASDLALRVNSIIESLPSGGHLDDHTRVYRVTATGPVEFPDQRSALIRFQFTVTCITRRV